MTRSRHLYFIIPLLWFLDTFLLGIFQQPTVSTLLCLYAVLLVRPVSARVLLFSLLFLSIESLLVHDSLAFSLIYLLPLSILVLEIKELVTHDTWLAYAFGITCMLLLTIASPLWMGQMLQSPIFIFFRICATIGVILIFEKFLITR